MQKISTYFEMSGWVVMAEIKIKISEINNAITSLQGLQSRCSSRDTTPPETVGGGKTVNELEKIADTYRSINTQFEGLISQTILFLENVRDSYVSSDTKAANKIANK